MKLLEALILADARLSGVNLVPTKRFFKPVIVMRAPLDQESAELIECSYLFTDGGRPVLFDGSVKVHGEVAGAEITLGKGGKPIIAERVAHFNVSRKEEKDDKPDGLEVRLRIHIAEFEDQADLLKLLGFLAELNKDQTTLTIQSTQGSLIAKKVEERPKVEPQVDLGFAVAQPDANGLYDMERAFKKPFANQKPALTAKLFGLEIEGGFIAGWEIKTGKGFELKFEAGATLSIQRSVYPSEREALEEAARELAEYTRSRVVTKPADHRALANVIDWLMTEGLLQIKKEAIS